MRTKAWRRYKDYTKAKRKRNIDVYCLGRPWNDEEGLHHWTWYNNLHQYSKNKIHCSCPMCSAKTRNKGKRRQKANGWYPSINYSMMDKRRQDSMDADLSENT